MLASSILHVCVFLVSFGIIKHLKHAGSGNMKIYHIFCCNMLIFACPIIVNSQCWLFALKANTGQISYLPSYIRICPRIQLPVSAQWSQRLYVKVQGKMMHKDMHKIVFQSN
jgi:hypothetical protein